jgi:hypothetical protein
VGRLEQLPVPKPADRASFLIRPQHPLPKRLLMKPALGTTVTYARRASTTRLSSLAAGRACCWSSTETRKLSVASSSPTTYAGQTGMYWPGITPNR